MRYTWIPFYKEFAEKLMNNRNDRASLLSLIYENREKLLAKYLHDNKGVDDLLTDVDPFTVFGLFNRGIKSENRINSAKLFKKLFNMNSDAPADFEGIPILNNQRSYFFGYRNLREKEDIDNLWSLFEKVVKGEDIEDTFNVVIKQYGININITMALFCLRTPIIVVTEQSETRKNRGTISMSTCGGSVRTLCCKVLPERARHIVSPNWWYACAALSLMQRMPLAKS